MRKTVEKLENLLPPTADSISENRTRTPTGTHHCFPVKTWKHEIQEKTSQSQVNCRVMLLTHTLHTIMTIYYSVSKYYKLACFGPDGESVSSMSTPTLEATICPATPRNGRGICWLRGGIYWRVLSAVWMLCTCKHWTHHHLTLSSCQPSVFTSFFLFYPFPFPAITLPLFGRPRPNTNT